ncbi:MAG: HIRAN domain-containing protein, partial [Zoogloeaceae bacterium]|nr:HIRAN domain-containing protein [Zoogloeaceae bacterium]
MGIDLCEWRALREWRRLRAIFLLFACLAHAAWGEESIRFLVQSSPLAGSQFHALARLAKDMRVGDALTLRREPDNRYDANAVRVEWKG